MKKWALRFLISALIEFLPVISPAIVNRQPGARSAALSSATVALPGIESVFHNPAGITSLKHTSVTLYYESLFLLKEFPLMACGVIIPTNSGSFGFGFQRLGNTIYQEGKAKIAYSKTLGDHIYAGIGFDYLYEKMPENRDLSSAFTVEGGVMGCISEQLMAGVFIFNPVQAKMNFPGGKTEIPPGGEAGFAWFPHSTLVLCGELEKVRNQPARVRTGVEYTPDEAISFRCGVYGAPLTFSMGSGFQFRRFRFDIAFSYHDALGLTPRAGISWIP